MHSLLLLSQVFLVGALNVIHPQTRTRTLALRDTSSSTSTPATTTSAAPAQLLQENPACIIVGEALSICQSVSPGFTTLDPTDQAKCLCYSQSVWQPTVFDGAVSGCAAFAATSIGGSVESVLSDLVGFCASIGDVEAVTPLITSAGLNGVQETGKVSSSISPVATIITPLLSTSNAPVSTVVLPTSIQPSVLSASSIQPTAVSNFIQTSSIATLVRTSSFTSTEASLIPLISSTPTSILPPSFTGTFPRLTVTPVFAPNSTRTVPPITSMTSPQGPDPSCRLFSSILGACTAGTTSFTILPPVYQAQCLCYITSIWVPNAFDGAVAGCWNSDAGAYSTVGGFCAGIGNKPLAITLPPADPTSTTIPTKITSTSVTSILVVPFPAFTSSSSFDPTASPIPSRTSTDPSILIDITPLPTTSISPSDTTVVQTSFSTPTTYLQIDKPSTASGPASTSSTLSQVLNGLGDSAGIKIVSQSQVLFVSAALAGLSTFL